MVRSRALTPEAVREDIAINLQRLNTPFIDVWMFHRDDPNSPVGPLVEELNAHKAAGKVRVFGASNWSHQRIQEFNEYAYKKWLQWYLCSTVRI